MKRLAILLIDLPGEDHNESTYRAITYLLAVLCGTQAVAEHHSYKGRIDIEVVVGNYIYIFEFKYNKSVKEAMEQIETRDYSGRYSLESRKIYLIAANFNVTWGYNPCVFFILIERPYIHYRCEDMEEVL